MVPTCWRSICEPADPEVPECRVSMPSKGNIKPWSSSWGERFIELKTANHHFVSSSRTTTYSFMEKVEDQLLPSYAHVPTPQTAKRSKRLTFWIFTLLAGVVVIGVNLRSGVQKGSWKSHTGCGKGHLRTNPRSYYTLPSGDKIPSVALGGSAPSPFRFIF